MNAIIQEATNDLDPEFDDLREFYQKYPYIFESVDFGLITGLGSAFFPPKWWKRFPLLGLSFMTANSLAFVSSHNASTLSEVASKSTIEAVFPMLIYQLPLGGPKLLSVKRGIAGALAHGAIKYLTARSLLYLD